MSDYLFRSEAPAHKRSFTVAEALEATGAAIHPASKAEGPVMILSIDKDLAGSTAALTPDDWKLLAGAWAGLAKPEFPMSLERWQTYVDAFESSPDKPDGWRLSAVQRDPEFQFEFARAITAREHMEILKRAVGSGVIALRNPMTGSPSELGWLGDADSWLLTRADMRAFCELLAIELMDAAAPAAPESSAETPKQRRARLLEAYDAEVSAGGQHGALARITKSEKLTRPTADRSDIGKQIKKAREERTAERKLGWARPILK